MELKIDNTRTHFEPDTSPKNSHSKDSVRQDGSHQDMPRPRLAEAIQCYVKSFEKNIELADIVVGLPVTIAQFNDDLVPRSLKRLGLIGSIASIKRLKDEHFPACAFLKNHQYVIIRERVGDHYKIESPVYFKGIRSVPCKSVDSYYTGKALIASHDPAEFERKYDVTKRKGHWFWSHFKSQKSLITDIISGTFVANILAVGISLFTLQVYDRVIPNQSESTLWVLTIGAILALSLERMLKIARANLIDVSGRKIEIEISTGLFQKLTGMRLSKRESSPSSLLYAIRDFSSVREFFTNTTISSAADIPFVLIFVGLIYMIAGNVVFVVLAAMVLIVVPSLLAQKKMVALTEEMLGSTSAANKVLIETTYGHETIKALRSENHFQRQWEELLELSSAKTTEQRLLTARLSFWAASIQQMAYIGAITYGVYFVFSGDLTVGAIIAISILTTRALSPVTSLANMLAKWQQVRASLDQLETIVNSEQDVTAGKTLLKADSLAGDYVLENVNYKYFEDGKPVLDIPNLTLTAGKKIGILGANGSGKSTLLRLLSGLYDPSAGNITIDGLMIGQIAPWDLRRHVGYLSQEIRLFSGSLRENLEMGCGAKSDKDLFDALKFSGLERFVKLHPHGLDMVIADGGSGVSTGQKQSIGLARLYLQEPTIVLMDEPTSSFDQMLELSVIANLKQWLDEKTCIITTHRPAVLNIVEEIIILQNGRISAQGEAKSIIAQLSSNQIKKTQTEQSRQEA